MSRFLRKFLKICISLSFVGALNGVASAQEDLEDIIAGTLAYIDKYESGRIAYTYEVESSPYERTDEQIETTLQLFDLPALRRRKDLSEDQISERLNEIRAVRIKHRSKKTWTKTSGKCEAVFDGDNQHVTNEFLDGVNTRLLERYDYNGNSTYISEIQAREKIPGGGTKPPITIHYADVRPGCIHADVQSVVDAYRRLRVILAGQDWAIFGTKIENGELVYVLKDVSHSARDYSLEIVPEKGYYINEFRDENLTEPASQTIRFINPTWNEDAQIYYPEKYVSDYESRHNPEKKQISRETHTLTDVHFNIDVPDETFYVRMKKNLTVNDYRADPFNHREYSYRKPDELRRFLNELNGVIDPKPAGSKGARRRYRRVSTETPKNLAFQNNAFKALDLAFPNSFDRVVVESKSRLLIYMKDEAPELGIEILTSILSLGAAVFQKEYGVSDFSVFIRRENGRTLVKGWYRQGELITEIYQER